MGVSDFPSPVRSLVPFLVWQNLRPCLDYSKQEIILSLSKTWKRMVSFGDNVCVRPN